MLCLAHELADLLFYIEPLPVSRVEKVVRDVLIDAFLQLLTSRLALGLGRR